MKKLPINVKSYQKTPVFIFSKIIFLFNSKPNLKVAYAVPLSLRNSHKIISVALKVLLVAVICIRMMVISMIQVVAALLWRGKFFVS